MDQTDRIKVKLRLAKNTDTFCEVFGANSHKYELNEPIDIEEVERFEKKYNITLPADYKEFLTKVGNGGNQNHSSVVGNSGAGPDYGIFKLGHSYHFIADPATGYLQKTPFFSDELAQDEWEEMADSITDDEYENGLAQIFAGIFAISFRGCSGFTGIMLSGKNTGRVAYFYDEIEYTPHFDGTTTFLDWYESWLDGIISGSSFISKTSPYKTEEDCFARYANDKEPYWKQVSLRYIRSFETLSPKYIKILWKNYQTEPDEMVRLLMLNLLAKFDYENVKNELIQLFQKTPIELLKILYLYTPTKIPEWEDMIADLRTNTLNQEAKEYIDHIITKELEKYNT